jgi:hypothetical protein
MTAIPVAKIDQWAFPSASKKSRRRTTLPVEQPR